MNNICIFGDSIAWGANDLENTGWVNLLWKYYNNKTNFDNEVYNLGISGDNSENLIKRFDSECEARDPKVIIIAIGINDSQYILKEDNPRITLEKFEENLNYLVNTSRKYTQKIIFVGLTRVVDEKTMPIPWNKEKFYSNKKVKEYNSIIQKICEKENLSYIPLLESLEESNFHDGLHPDTDGHKIIFEKVKNFLNENKIL